MKIIYLMLLFLISNLGFSLSCDVSRYEIKENKVYYSGFYYETGEKEIFIPEADAATFVSEDFVGASQSRYGRDKNNVFFYGGVLKNVDAKTFKILSLRFDTRGSMWGTTCETAEVTYIDKNGAYFENNKILNYTIKCTTRK